jgi:hypothetical protein
MKSFVGGTSGKHNSYSGLENGQQSENAIVSNRKQNSTFYGA